MQTALKRWFRLWVAALAIACQLAAPGAAPAVAQTSAQDSLLAVAVLCQGTGHLRDAPPGAPHRHVRDLTAAHAVLADALAGALPPRAPNLAAPPGMAVRAASCPAGRPAPALHAVAPPARGPPVPV